MTRLRTSILLLLAGLVLLGAPGPASTQSLSDDAWNGSTAHTLSKGRLERGVFLPLRWGVSDQIELTAYALAEPLVPNARAKIAWRERDDLAISTVHALAYPTPLMNLIAREGTGGILPATSEIPPMLTVRKGVLLTRTLSADHDLTMGAFVTTTPRFGEADFTTIDFPIVYPRTASHHTVATYRQSLRLRGPVAGPFQYRADVDFFVLPGLEGSVAVEHTGRLAWVPGRKFRAMLGYIVTFGEYAFGTQWNVYPMFDLQFGWQLGG